MMNKQDQICHSLQSESQKNKKRFFTHKEDNLIKHFYEDMEIKDWAIISSYLDNRTPKNCRDRYHNYFDSKLNLRPFNLEDDDLIIELVLKHGKKWNKIAYKMNNRSPGAVKSRWYKHLSHIIKKEFINSVSKKQVNRKARLMFPEIQPNESDNIWTKDYTFFNHSDWFEQKI
jgi:hypothetical protein